MHESRVGSKDELFQNFLNDNLLRASPWEVYRKTFCLTLRFLRQELILNNNFCFIMLFSDGIYKFMGVDVVANQAGSTWDQ